MIYITGDRFVEMSDVFYGDVGLKMRNPQKLNSDKMIVFCETHRLKEFFQIANKKQSPFDHPFTLISHNSDGCIVNSSTREFDYVLNPDEIPKNVIGWYAQNLDVDYTMECGRKIQAIPIGLENYKWHKGEKWRDLSNVRVKFTSKSGILYLNVEPSTNPTERNSCINSLKELNWVTYQKTKLPYIEYLKQMARCMYVACPEGNGLDTHRMWEAIYLRCIPMVRDRIFTNQLSEYYPIALIDTWERKKGNTIQPLAKFNFKNPETYLSFGWWEGRIRRLK